MKFKFKTLFVALAMFSFSLTAFAASELYVANQYNIEIDSFKELVVFSLIKSNTL